jgi:ubiquinone/menaquinone biosynthesis C-methylase UbiE
MSLAQDDGSAGKVERQDQELWQLNDLLKKEDGHAPALKSTSQDDVTTYFAAVADEPKLLASSSFHDFLSLHVNGSQLTNICNDLKFFTHGMVGFIETLAAKIPVFSPPYVNVTEDNFFATAETPLECWVYTKATQVGLKDIELAYALNFNYSNAMPPYSHPADNLETYAPDVSPPGYAGTPFAYPEKYIDYPVHFQPKGYVNGHNIRLEYTSANKFYFDTEDNIRNWIQKVHQKDPADRFKPLRILEIGASTGLSTLIYADMFPNANVTGIDLAAPFVRFCRQRAGPDQWNKQNVEFFHGNAENMTYFEDNTFDIVSYTLVLHESTGATSQRILKELLRILKPGGRMSGFEVAYLSNPIQRAQVEFFTTFGFIGDKDWAKVGFHGPEPFMKEFQTLNLPKAVPEAGFVNTSYDYIDVFEGTYLGYKPWN